MRLKYIHRMRALAIVSVVAVHANDQLEWSQSPSLQRFMENLLQGSTVLFFMIAGFLFHHLSQRFEFGDYLLRKVKNVIVPFLIISAPGIALLLNQPAFLASHPEMTDQPTWVRVAFLVGYAGAQINYPLWFVPVMASLFVLAPLFMALLRQPRLFDGALVLMLAVSLLAHRADVSKYHHLELVMYYIGPYMLGMWASRQREDVHRFVDRQLGLIALVFLALLLGFTFFTDYRGSYVKTAFSQEKGLLDWVLLQKLVLFFLLVGLTRRWEKKSLPRLDFLAEASFPIFFLHMYVILAAYHLTNWWIPAGSVLSLIGTTAGALGGSMLIVMMSRLTLRSHSRWVLGA